MSPADDPTTWPSDLAFAHRLAELADSISLDHFGKATSTIKSDGSPVSEGDLAVDRALTVVIRSEYPDDAILSEESEPSGDSSRRWILDPIDGTVFFLAGQDTWGTHIALEENGDVVLGVVTRPLRAKVWWALRGHGSWAGTVRGGAVTEPVRLLVSGVDELSRSRVTVWPAERHPDMVQRVKKGAQWAEPYAERLLELLVGQFEAVCGYAGGPWDHAPAVVLVEEAGGRFCDPAGGRRLDLGGGIYTNGKIDAELRALLDGP
ncbi:MAG: inositol monophosphatase family protein [Acidimicrobiales bacterium]